MKLFTSDGCSYEGMDSDTVTRLRIELGKETFFVDESAYNDYLAAQRVK